MFGFAICFAIQVFVTIGGGTRLIPLTGVTLPLISMGGSSLCATVLMFSIIQGVYVKEFDYKNLSKEAVQELEDEEDEEDEEEDGEDYTDDDSERATVKKPKRPAVKSSKAKNSPKSSGKKTSGKRNNAGDDNPDSEDDYEGEYGYEADDEYSDEDDDPDEDLVPAGSTEDESVFYTKEFVKPEK